jgi:uncharacterized alkaline shock family protein YloU
MVIMEQKNDVIEEVVEIPQETAGEETSSVKIAPDVVATIAGVSASEIKGVAGMCSTFAGGIAEILGARKNATKGIKVEIKDKTTIIDMYIIVEYGVRIPELAWEIQENVKNNVETMTGLTVDKVNIHIDGISFKKAQEQESTEQTDVAEEAEEIIVEETELEDIPESDEQYL